MQNPELSRGGSILDQRMTRRLFLRRASMASAGLFLAASASAIVLPTQAQAAAISSRVDTNSLEFRQAVAKVTSEIEAAGVTFPSFLSTAAARAEEEWIDVGPEPRELNQEQWFPYDAALARDRGLVRMHSLGGPLDIHDQITGRRAREWEEEKANLALRRDPRKRGSLGHCDDVANIMAYHIPLPVEVLNGGTFLFEGLEINKTTVIGLQAEMHAHDLKMAYRNDPVGILAILAVGSKKGYAPVANIPGLGREGEIWTNVIKKIRADFGRVEAYNFGWKINVSTDEIVSAYFPFHYNPNDPESYQGIDAGARAETIGAFNPELDHEVVNSITLNQQG